MDNELKDIILKLEDQFCAGSHWQVLKAEKADSGNWVLVIQKLEKPEAEHENN